jgi:rhamnulokinase
MSPAKFLAIDIGASSGRAVLGSIKNNKLNTREIHRFINQPINVLGHIHWNIFSLFEEIKLAMTHCAQNFTCDLNGIAIDTWGVDFGLISVDDVFLGLPYAYRDSRTNGMMKKAFEYMPKAEIYQHTGIQFMQLNTIFQLLAMVQADSPLLKIADKLLFMPDALNFLFSGIKAAEFSIASTSQLYDPINKIWSAPVFEKLNLPRQIMPEIIQTGTELGPLFPEIAKDTGLNSVSIIASAGHDTAAAVAAVPAEGDDWAYLSSGTWSLMGIEIENPIINEQSLNYNFTNEGGVGGSIRFLKNIAGLWIVQECRRIWQREGEDYDFATLTEMANQARPFISVIDPDDSLFLLPENMPEAIHDYLRKTDQKIPQTKGETIRIVLESLALKYRATLEQINILRGQPIKKLHLVGGGTKNELLNQFTANSCGIPVIAGPTEATAVGNIAVQTIAKGVLGSIEDARQVIRNSFELKEYNPEETTQWNKMYAKFTQIVNFGD